METCSHVEGNVEMTSGDLHASCSRAAVCGQRAVGALHLGQPEKETLIISGWKLKLLVNTEAFIISSERRTAMSNKCGSQRHSSTPIKIQRMWSPSRLHDKWPNATLWSSMCVHNHIFWEMYSRDVWVCVGACVFGGNTFFLVIYSDEAAMLMRPVPHIKACLSIYWTL